MSGYDCRKECGWNAGRNAVTTDAVWVIRTLGPRKHVLRGVHIGATWRIRLKSTCAAAMRPFFVKIR